MIEQQGRVIGLDGPDALVAIGGRSGCSACDAGEGCGAGLFGRLLDRVDAPLRVPNTLDAGPGQAVRLGLTERAFLELVFRLYGLPLCLGIGGAVIAFFAVQPMVGRSGWIVDAAVLSGALIAGGWGLRRSRRRLEQSFTRLSPVMLDAVTGLDCGASDRIA